LFAHIVAHNLSAMLERISMADVAVKAGVSQSTVSRALKDNPRISIAQRRRVLRIAQSLGYRPHPLVSALMAVRRAPRGRSGLETLAFISNHAGPREWTAKPTCVATFSGIIERAAELGFKIEVFATREHGGKPGRLERVLHARGIRGVILGFTVPSPPRLEFNQTGFAVAGLGAYFPHISVDRTQSHGFYNVKLALQQLRALGYNRIGLVTPGYNNLLSDNTWSAAYLDDQWTQPRSRRCEPFLPDTWSPEPAVFGRWLQRWQPDALLVYKINVFPLLAGLGHRVPRDIGVALIFRTQAETQAAAGVDENYHHLGRITVDLAVEKLNTNRLGPTDPTKEVLARGFWRDGPTVLKQNASA
jgi:LacI family transcriptional regulator/LacI family fructose operon transcriptional repressor